MSVQYLFNPVNPVEKVPRHVGPKFIGNPIFKPIKTGPNHVKMAILFLEL